MDKFITTWIVKIPDDIPVNALLQLGFTIAANDRISVIIATCEESARLLTWIISGDETVLNNKKTA